MSNRLMKRRRLGRVGLRIALLLLLLTVIASVAGAVQINRKISGVMTAFGGIAIHRDVRVSPDGQYVIYLAEQETDEVIELYSVRLDSVSSLPVKLNSSLVSGGDVDEFLLSADGSRVVYLADQDRDEVFELYSAPLDGSSSPVKLNRPLGNGKEVFSDFQISPDSSRVVYRTDQAASGAEQVYSVPIDRSSNPVRLNGPLVSGGDVEEFQISADNSRVVYRADQQTDDTFELYSVLLDGSAGLVKLNGGLVSGGDVADFRISPDSSRVVYRADQQTDEVDELGSVPLDGSGPAVKLNGTLVSGGDVSNHFLISPDSSWVVYQADQDTDSVNELYKAPLDGASPAEKVNDPLVSGGVVYVGAFEISADSSRVVYNADQDTDNLSELYSVPLDGSAGSAKLNGPMVPGRAIFAGFLISPDSSRVIYKADQDTDDVVELYSAPLAGGVTPVKLNGPLVSGGEVGPSLQISPDSSRVLYIADQDPSGISELYSAPLSGGATPVKINGPLVSNGYVTEFKFSPDSSQVFYVADQETDNLFELFVTYDQPPLVSFETATMTVSEGAGLVTTPVQLNVPLTSTVQVDYAVSGGTATGSGVDYSLTDGTLSFAPGVITQPLKIILTDDSDPETDETVVVSLSNPQNVGLGTPSVFTLTIQANEAGSGAGDFSVYLPLVRR